MRSPLALTGAGVLAAGLAVALVAPSSGAVAPHAASPTHAKVSGPSHRAGTAVVVGSTTGTPQPCGDITGVMTTLGPGTPSYGSPITGVITSWSTSAGVGAHLLRMLVVTPSTTTVGAWTIVAKTAMTPLAPSTVNTFPVRLPIKAGQQLGVDVPDNTGAFCGLVGVAGDTLQFSGPTDTDVATEFLPTNPGTGFRVNASAVVEPDVDNDGFGDVSQDLCPQSAATQIACPAPQTTVSKKPKKSSTNRKVKIKFASSIPGSTFSCAVDGKAAKPCKSPFKKTFKYGKHKVVITAISQFGVPDPTPVKVKFKITRP